MTTDPDKRDLLATPVEPLDVKTTDVVKLVEAMGRTALSGRELGRAARIVDAMIAHPHAAVILTLAGSVVSAGMRQVIRDLVEHDMVDALVATGANVVDQDFFEALGFRHYQGDRYADDDALRRLRIDRIYDHYIDEDELRVCDDTIYRIAQDLDPGAWSSRGFVREMGRWLAERDLGDDSIVRTAYRKQVPIFVPAFADCSAGFGLVRHQAENPQRHVVIDAVRDFRELTELKVHAGETGLWMLGGGAPKNFVQDVVVSADYLGFDAAMHRWAVQLTVADERDGALSGSTLREANSWGKVARAEEQMVFGEITVTLPLVAGYAYHRGSWRGRAPRRLGALFEAPVGAAE